MRAERSSPGTIEAPLEGARRKLYLVKEDLAEKERKTFLAAFTKRVNGLMDDLGLPLEFEKQLRKIALQMHAKPSLSTERCEEPDPDEFMKKPDFRAERVPVRGVAGAYVSTECVSDKNGNVSDTVRPDGRGAYPDADDLKAARTRDFFLVRAWMYKDHIRPEDASLIMYNYDPKPKQWLWRAMEALRAASPELEPERVANMSVRVIKDLVDAHRKHAESL